MSTTVGYLGGDQDAAANQGSLKTAHGAGAHGFGCDTGKASDPVSPVSLGGDGSDDRTVPATLSTDCCDAWRSETNPHGAE